MASAVTTPRVAVLGSAGAGKSSACEKLTGINGLSSNASASATRSATTYETSRLQITDTPATNSSVDRFQHNLWVAQALACSPLSLILIVVSAEDRIDTVLSKAVPYFERLIELQNLLCLLVTKMDTVTWTQHEFLEQMEAHFGTREAVFSGRNITGDQLSTQIVAKCKVPRVININSEQFLSQFPFHNSHLAVLNIVQEEVGFFNAMNEQFLEGHNMYPEGNEKVDLVFEYQAFMTNEISVIQNRVVERCGFTFTGPNEANELGHIANLLRLLKSVLFRVRTIAVRYQSAHGVTALRKCPYCPCVWVKVAGCDGETKCGTRANTHDARYNSMHTFTFDFNPQTRRFSITKNAARNVQVVNSGGSVGCGQTITWSQMAPVAVPTELKEDPVVHTEDIPLLPGQQQNQFDRIFRARTETMHVPSIKAPH